jgi:Fe-S cluster biogenesis protein NfuA
MIIKSSSSFIRLVQPARRQNLLRLPFQRIIIRNIHVHTESTPNPHSLKFMTGQEVLPEKFGTGVYYQRNDLKEIIKSSLAKSIFAIDGIKSVFFGKDFITITKDVEEAWLTIKPRVFTSILDFYAADKPIIDEHTQVSDTTVLDTDDEIVASIKELIETRVRPSVQEDGGDIFYEGFDPIKGIVQVRLAGSCVGCPSSSVTLRNGVEKMLMHYIPEVKGIEEVGQLEKEGEGGEAAVV